MKLQKVIFASLIALAFSVCLGRLDVCAERYDGWTVREAPTSSGSITGLSSSGKCVVGAVYASSQTLVTDSAYFVLLDTNAAERINMDSFATDNFRSPAFLFPVSTTSVSGGGYTNVSSSYKIADYMPDGISFSTAPYVFKSAATSGFSRRVYLLIKQ